MKYFKLSIFTISVFFCFAFCITDKKLENHLLKVGETITFSNKPISDKHFTTTSMRKGAYDGSTFHLKSDKESNLSLTNINQPTGPNQDEIIIYGCTGQLKRNIDDVTFSFEKCKKKYYLINLDSARVVAVFDTISYLKLKSTNFNGNSAEFYRSEKDKSDVLYKSYSLSLEDKKTKKVYNNTNINLMAVPKDMKKDDLFKTIHEEKTLAYFSLIEFKVENNKIVTFPKGNYILCEGNSFDLK